MQVSVEVKEGLKRQVKVTVPAEQVESAISKRLAEMTGKVKIKGFRAGKVPKAEVERRYSASVRQEVVGQLFECAHVKPPDLLGDRECSKGGCSNPG